MKSEILTYIALATGLIGVVLSILTIYRKRKAEQNLEILLKKSQKELNIIKSIGEIRNEAVHSNRVLSFDEFVTVQETLKKLISQLDDKQKEEILESLEQKSVKGQLDYLNKIIHLSGSTENIIIKHN